LLRPLLLLVLPMFMFIVDLASLLYLTPLLLFAIPAITLTSLM
jgi:hypothetical protein